ncbi:twin-arginine translocase subunit TatC, partial [Tetzosporium hominis]
MHEPARRATLSYIPFAFLLFLGGVAFSYFLLFPYLMSFLTGLAGELGITQLISINDYFNFIFQIT